MTDFLTKEQRSKLMSKVRSKGSEIELIIKKALDDGGIKYTYQSAVFGKPDFLIKPNIAVFCDSSFWHGRNWRKMKTTLKEGYWQDHIMRNRKRDALVNRTLKKQGYIVLRFWDKEIRKNTKQCITEIQKAMASTLIPAKEKDVSCEV
jgi:DNA mismatch endonuclease, patch repair protein